MWSIFSAKTLAWCTVDLPLLIFFFYLVNYCTDLFKKHISIQPTIRHWWQSRLFSSISEERKKSINEEAQVKIDSVASTGSQGEHMNVSFPWFPVVAAHDPKRLARAPYSSRSYWLLKPILTPRFSYVQQIQGGSNMTGTDLCVNKPHCAAAVRPWESEATTSTLPPARVRNLFSPVWELLEWWAIMVTKKKKSVPVIFEPSCTTAPSNRAEDDFRSFVMTFNTAQRQTVKSAGIHPPSPSLPLPPFRCLFGTIPVLFIWQYRSCNYWKASTTHRKQQTNNITQFISWSSLQLQLHK